MSPAPPSAEFDIRIVIRKPFIPHGEKLNPYKKKRDPIASYNKPRFAHVNLLAILALANGGPIHCLHL